MFDAYNAQTSLGGLAAWCPTFLAEFPVQAVKLDSPLFVEHF